ncbi:hypothetical protein NPIL_693611 [Nephila pilipes]|uniref:Uncharacterized protein n=1 Tax=Nephila pilipes TaxID=299642 RepID=A0A8X6NK71_NEPPI|nr:hypothetical protein NPIL_693611 [Nephila pilipes]
MQFVRTSLAQHCDNSSHTTSLSHYSAQLIESLDSNLRKPIAKRALASTEETLHRLEAAQVTTPSSSFPATLSSNGIREYACIPT